MIRIIDIALALLLWQFLAFSLGLSDSVLDDLPSCNINDFSILQSGLSKGGQAKVSLAQDLWGNKLILKHFRRRRDLRREVRMTMAAVPSKGHSAGHTDTAAAADQLKAGRLQRDKTQNSSSFGRSRLLLSRSWMTAATGILQPVCRVTFGSTVQSERLHSRSRSRSRSRARNRNGRHRTVSSRRSRAEMSKILAYPFMPNGDLYQIPIGMPQSQRKLMAARLIAIVKSIHAQGIIHYDIKPGNILLDDHFHPVLIDFGLAARAAGRPHYRTGTYTTMAPEVARARINGIDFSQSDRDSSHRRPVDTQDLMLADHAFPGTNGRFFGQPKAMMAGSPGSRAVSFAADWWSVGATIWMLNVYADSKNFDSRHGRRAHPYRVQRHGPRGRHQRITYRLKDFPITFPPELCSLLSMLMAIEPAERQFDYNDVLEKHPYFRGIRW